jgi:hypothetical protein
VLIVVDPAAAIVLSLWLFDDRFTNNPVEIAIAVVSFLVMTAGVVALTRTAPADLDPGEPARLEDGGG